MTLYDQCMPQFIKILGAVGRWLDAAEEFAKSKNFEPAVLVQARLAPDQYALARQVQTACDMAKFAATRLSGKEAPAHPDTEQTLEELKQRVRATVAFLESVRPGDFEGAEDRKVVLPFMPGKFIRGRDYLTEFVVPNFYFHATTAYAILRHNGVPLGKIDFISALSMHDA